MGRSVNCRYTAANRREIIDRAYYSTRVVERRSRRVRDRAYGSSPAPRRFMPTDSTPPTTNTLGILGGSEPTPRTPGSSVSTWRLRGESPRLGSNAAHAKVATRSAMTMAPPTRGVFDVLPGLVRRGLGGRLVTAGSTFHGSTRADFLASVDWLNSARHERPRQHRAPEPLSNAGFMRALREAWGRAVRPACVAVDGGTRARGALRTESELVLKSRCRRSGATA